MKPKYYKYTPNLFSLFYFMVTMSFTLFGTVCNAAIFEDLTAKRFRGKDDLLEAFELKNMIVGCSEADTSTTVISWHLDVKNSTERTLEAFVINFEIKDRHDKVIIADKFKWEKGVASGPGRVSSMLCWDHIHSIPGNDAVGLPVSIGQYSKVSYWVNEIKISNPRLNAEKNKIETLEATKKMSLAKLEPLQTNACDLILIQACSDYSKNISLGKYKMGEKLNARDLANEFKLILEKKDFKMDNRLIFYKSAEAQNNKSAYISIYTDKKDVMKYVVWTDSKSSMPWHSEGLQEWSKRAKNFSYAEDIRSLLLGPETISVETTQYGIKSVRSAVGERPPEIVIGPILSLKVWSIERDPQTYFEAHQDCSKETGVECVESSQKLGDLKGKKFKRYKNSNRKAMYSFAYNRGANEPLTRHFMYESMEACKNGREIQHYTRNDYGSILQTSCAPLQNFNID